MFGGKEITTGKIEALKNKLKIYNLINTSLEIKQSFAYLSDSDTENDEQLTILSNALDEKEKQQKIIQSKLDSIYKQQKISLQIYSELKVQYPAIKNAIIQPVQAIGDTLPQHTYLILLNLSQRISQPEKLKIENWLKVRLHQNNIKLILQ